MKSIPTTYRGTRMRSRLEASWAATFDQLDIVWQYEPQGVEVEGSWYLPDFYLPAMRTYVEVKGPHDERVYKTEALARELAIIDPAGSWSDDWQTVVVARVADTAGHADWHDASGPDTSAVVLVYCGACLSHSFTDLSGRRACRVCGQAHGVDDWQVLYTPAGWNSANGIGLTRPLPAARTTLPMGGAA